jgi:hypothetical protein
MSNRANRKVRGDIPLVACGDSKPERRSAEDLIREARGRVAIASRREQQRRPAKGFGRVAV